MSRSLKAWGRRLTIFSLERVLEAVFFGAFLELILIGTGMSDLTLVGGFKDLALALVFLATAPIVGFHLASGYPISCVILGLAWRLKSSLRFGVLFTIVAVVHSFVLVALTKLAFLSMDYAIFTTAGIPAVFLANYLGASLLQRWDAAAARKAPG